MIVNQTTLDEKDKNFLWTQLRRQPDVIIRRIALFFISVFMLIAGGYGLHLVSVWHFPNESSYRISFVFSMVLGLYFMYIAVFQKKITNRRDSKLAYLFVQRTYTIDENCISVQYSVNGVVNSAQYALENVECYWDTAGAIYLRVVGIDKKKKLYMCIHDDGYIEEGREDFTALLKNKDIRPMQK